MRDNTNYRPLRVDAALADRIAAAAARWGLSQGEVCRRSVTAYQRRHYVDLSPYADGDAVKKTVIRPRLQPDAPESDSDLRAIIRWHLTAQESAHGDKPLAKPDIAEELAKLPQGVKIVEVIA